MFTAILTMTGQKVPMELAAASIDSDAVMSFIQDNFEGLEVS